MESFLVSARKYRPVKWSDVLGQEHVAQTLKNALQKSQVAHAFLFCGPRGVGKTTCARILAQVLNCENPSKDWEPCNTCSLCQSFRENASFNIFELDAASNNSVDDIRDLVEQVRYQPQYGKYKIYIIDEVHMLSQAAFNAFLKTLEEPPPYAKFILATTEKHKILPTILSRCQVYDFRRISEQDIVKQLEKIVSKEKITAEEEALHLIAQKADGAMRDALSIFDRITSFSDKKITYQDAIDNLNVLDQDSYFKLVDALISEDISSTLIQYDAILRNGFDSEILLEGLATHIRNLFICKNPEMQSLFESTEKWKKKFAEQADNCSLSFLTSALSLINDSEINLVRARNKRLHTEICLTKLCYLGRQKEFQFTSQAVGAEKKTPELNTAQEAQSINTPTRDSQIIKSEIEVISPKIAENANKSKGEKSPAESHAPASISSSAIPKILNLNAIKQKVAESDAIKKANILELTNENVQEFWNDTMEVQKSQSLKAYMKTAVVQLSRKEIIISVGSILAKEAIRKEAKLEERIRTFFHDDQLKAIVEIDPELADKEEKQKPKKLLSAKEKWELLENVNPAISFLKDTLELKIDED